MARSITRSAYSFDSDQDYYEYLAEPEADRDPAELSLEETPEARGYFPDTSPNMTVEDWEDNEIAEETVKEREAADWVFRYSNSFYRNAKSFASA